MRYAISVAMILAFAAAAPLGAQERSPVPTTTPPDTNIYAWTGEVVTLDQTLRTVTLKARLTGPEAVSEAAGVKPGDRVLINWFGYGGYTNGVRAVKPYSTTQIASDSFLFPAELVSTDTQNVTIRIRVPQSAVATLKALKPGDWVRVRARHEATSDTEAIVDIKPYVAFSGN
jgi:hypothetical protein